jgi:hypothetical protein
MSNKYIMKAYLTVDLVIFVYYCIGDTVAECIVFTFPLLLHNTFILDICTIKTQYVSYSL